MLELIQLSEAVENHELAIEHSQVQLCLLSEDSEQLRRPEAGLLLELSCAHFVHVFCKLRQNVEG